MINAHINANPKQPYIVRWRFDISFTVLTQIISWEPMKNGFGKISHQSQSVSIFGRIRLLAMIWQARKSYLMKQPNDDSAVRILAVNSSQWYQCIIWPRVAWAWEVDLLSRLVRQACVAHLHQATEMLWVVCRKHLPILYTDIVDMATLEIEKRGWLSSSWREHSLLIC